MISTTVFRRGAALLLGLTAVGVVPTVSNVSAAPATCAAESLCAGGEYFPVTPTRIFDQRGVDANGEVVVPVVGVNGIDGAPSGVPADGVLAVAVNVTIAGAAGNGFASVSPSDYVGGGDPTSLINFQYAGHTVPNFGIIGVGAQGEIKIDLSTESAGSSRVIVDVFGFVATSGFEGTDDAPLVDGARMVTVTPQRLYDSREIGATLGAKQSVEIPVRGRAGVPTDPDVTAVVVNLTGINNPSGNTGTYLTLTPEQVSSSLAEAPSSNGNYPSGVTKANLAIVPINDAGSIWLYNRGGRINVALDVVAYLETGADETSRTGRIVPLEAPFRSFDTREPEFGSAKLGFSSWEDWSFDDFAGSVQLNGAAIGEQAGLFGNLTAVALERLYATVPVRSFLTMNPATPGEFPAGAPGNSNLNFTEGGAVANSSVVTYGDKDGDDNMVSTFNADGRTHYFLDVYAVILK
ncbi:MAG: hypothetical protein ABJH68_01540 [Ilumatobacter sp.]|uniref:hypothetical protein n=1 Tax=Ilumatobacter sp. TaxID=1967498 RepID=UPI003298618F